jgi:hypothetical protein
MEGFGWLILSVIVFIMIAGGYFWLTDDREKPHKPIIHFGGWRGFGGGDGDGGGDGGGGGNGGGG